MSEFGICIQIAMNILKMMLKGGMMILSAIPKVLKGLYKTGLYWLLGCVVLLVGNDMGKIEETIEMDILFILFVIASVIAMINRIISAFRKEKINILKSGAVGIYELVTGSIISNVEKNGHISKLKNTYQEPTGTVLAYNGSKYICIPNENIYHGALVGGTGSGKSVFLSATLLSNPCSMLVADCKDGGELRRISGKVREKRLGHEIKFFNPEDRETFHFNPFEVFDFMNEPETDIADFLACSMIDKSVSEKSPVWTDNARILLSGIILYCRAKRKSFNDTIEFIQTTPVTNIIETIKEESDNCKNAWRKVSFFDGMALETLSGVESNMRSKLSCFSSENVINALSDSSKKISPLDLESGKCTIFYSVALNKTADQWQGLSRLFFNIFFAYFSRRGEKFATDGKTPEKILFMLDEFPSLGKVDNFDTQVSLVRSAGISVLIAFQSLGQLYKLYGKDVTQVLLDNMGYDVVLQCKDPESQLYFSKLSGKREKKKKSKSSNYNADIVGIGKGTGSGSSVTTEEKYLFREDTFGYLPNENKCIVYLPDGVKKCEKVLYFKDKYLEKILEQ